MVLYAGARGRVRGLDLVDVVTERVPVGVVLFLFLVVVVVFVFFVRVSVLFLAARRQDLYARGVFLFAVVFAGVVVDSDSFPESDGDVSVAFHIARGGKRNAGRGCRAGCRAGSARRRRDSTLGRAVRKRPPRGL